VTRPWRQFSRPGKHVSLYNTGIRELSLAERNATLARAGLVLKARQTYSERLVACVTAPGKVEGKTLFWLQPVTPEGVVDEDGDEGDESRAETQPLIPDRLALPAGEPGEGA
jgi:hypothetical protein